MIHGTCMQIHLEVLYTVMSHASSLSSDIQTYIKVFENEKMGRRKNKIRFSFLLCFQKIKRKK